MSFRFISGLLILLSVAAAQEVGVSDYLVEHPECPLFGPKYNKLISNAVTLQGLTSHRTALSALTSQVVTQLGFVPGGSRTDAFSKLTEGSIDSYIFGALQAEDVGIDAPLGQLGEGI